jgi:hypothetical protein
MINDEDLVEYQAIYKQKFGKEISRADALEQGTKLIRLMQIVCQAADKDKPEIIC